MNEEEILKLLNDNVIACCCGYEYDKAIQGILDLYQKEKEKNAELSDKLTLKICQGVEEKVLAEYRQKLKNSISKDKIKAKIEDKKREAERYIFDVDVEEGQAMYKILAELEQELFEEE